MRLAPVLVADIERKDAHAVRHRLDPQFEPALRSIGIDEVVEELLGLASAHHALERLEHRRLIDPRITFRHPAADEFVRLPARMPLRGFVQVQIGPVEPDDLHAFQQLLDGLSNGRLTGHATWRSPDIVGNRARIVLFLSRCAIPMCSILSV